MRKVSLKRRSASRCRRTTSRARCVPVCVRCTSPFCISIKRKSDMRASKRETGSAAITGSRSEEHTSELQSPDHLVCRLLLEKKKKQPQPSQHDTNGAQLNRRTAVKTRRDMQRTLCLTALRYSLERRAASVSGLTLPQPKITA